MKQSMSSYLEQQRKIKLMAFYKEMVNKFPLINQLIYGKEAVVICKLTFREEKVNLYLHQSSPEILVILWQEQGINSFDLKKITCKDWRSEDNRFGAGTCLIIEDLSTEVILKFDTEYLKLEFERALNEISLKMKEIPSETDSQILKNFIKADKNRNRMMEFSQLNDMLSELKINSAQDKHRIFSFIEPNYKLLPHRFINIKQFERLCKFMMCKKEFLREFMEATNLKDLEANQSYFDKVMTKEQFLVFLKMTQGESMNSASCIADKIFYKPSNKLSFVEFCQFMCSPENRINSQEYENSKVTQDLPLNLYHCYSSHNTYLTGDQLQSDSRAQRYFEDLQRGIRCVEIDCYDGKNGPIVTHGFTMTSNITFFNVIAQIGIFRRNCDKKHSPIIISIENHCNVENQQKMAQIMINQFGINDIFTIKQFRRKKQESKGQLSAFRSKTPTVRDLQGKIIIKCSGKFEFYDRYILDAEKQTFFNENDPYMKQVQQRRQDNLAILTKVQKISPLLLELTSMLGKGQLGSPCYWESVSISEDNLFQLYSVEQKRQMIAGHTRSGWIRSYPGGHRVDSSNYNPMPAIEMGVQIIAANSQIGDTAIHLLHRFFDKGKNSLIGYRPHCTSLRTLRTQEMTIKPISAVKLYYSNLSRKKQMPVCQVQMRLYHHMNDQKYNKKNIVNWSSYTEEITNNCYNPIFQHGSSMRVQYTVEELSFIAVRIKDVGMGIIPLQKIKKGYRYVTLFDEQLNEKDSKVFFLVK